jgi:O-antigen ligase
MTLLPPPNTIHFVPYAKYQRKVRGRRGALLYRVLPDLLSIESSFLLFLVSGLLKEMPGLRQFPVDFTILFFCTTSALIVFAAFNHRIKPYKIHLAGLLAILFGLLALTSLCWSSNDPANFDKAQRFLLLTLPSFFIAQMIGQDSERRKRFVRVLLCISFGLLLYYAYCVYILGMTLQPGEFSDKIALRDHYLEYGYNAQNFFIICLVIASFGPTISIWPAFIAVGFTLYLMLGMGGRGPLVGAVMAAALIALGFGWRGQRWSRQLVFLGCIIVVGATGYSELSDASSDAGSFRTLWRIQAQLTGEDTTSLDERAAGRALAVQIWLEEPFFGGGFGEYRVRDPFLKWPHNTPLEILSEMGIVGGLLFVGIILYPVRACLIVCTSRSHDWTLIALALIFIVEIILHSSTKGYLADDRTFFAYAGLLTGYFNKRLG